MAKVLNSVIVQNRFVLGMSAGGSPTPCEWARERTSKIVGEGRLARAAGSRPERAPAEFARPDHDAAISPQLFDDRGSRRALGGALQHLAGGVTSL